MEQSTPLQGFTKEQIMAMAQSDAGKRLIAYLQQANPDQLQKAMDGASSGNYQQVKEALNGVLNNKQAQKLIQEMRD